MQNFRKIGIIFRKVIELWKNCNDSLFHATCQIGRMCNSLNIICKVRVTDRLIESLLLFLWGTRWGRMNSWEWITYEYYKRQGFLCNVGAKAEKTFQLQAYSTTSQPYDWTQMKVAWISLRMKTTNNMDYGVQPKYHWYDWVTEWRLGQCERY